MNLPLAKKLWQASRVLNTSPFSPELLHHSEVQLDFILEMHALDNPKELVFERTSSEKILSETETLAQWDQVLIGKSKQEFFAGMLPSKAVLERAMGIQKTSAELVKAAKEQ